MVQVGQAVATRDALARELSLRVLMPMLLLIPLLAVLVAWVLQARPGAAGRDLARACSDRDAARLDPLPTRRRAARSCCRWSSRSTRCSRASRRSLDAQRRFVADAAHELRSPVAALALQVQLAERAQSEAARAAALAELELRHRAHAAGWCSSCSTSRAWSRACRPSCTPPVDLAALAREVVGAFAARADGQDVDLGVDAPPAVLVTGAASELRSLIANLVDNALRYAPRGSAVTVSLREAGEHGRARGGGRRARHPGRASASACSSASTASPATPRRAAASAWRSPRRSSSATAARCGSPMRIPARRPPGLAVQVRLPR